MDHRWRVGERFGAWCLVQPLGAGGTGAVWRARHVRSGEEAVIKIAHGPAQALELVRGARAQEGLREPHVVRVLEIDPRADGAYAVYEPCLGGTLRDRLARGPLGRAELLAVFDAVLHALAAAHRNQMVHLDVKPENVLCTKDGLWKLTDFGGVDTSGPRDVLENSLSVRGLGARVTPRYLPPELWRPERIEYTADLYSCGVMWFECVTGRLPHDGELPSEQRANCPWWIDAFFKRLMGSAERRFADASDALRWATWHINGWPTANESVRRSPFRRDLRASTSQRRRPVWIDETPRRSGVQGALGRGGRVERSRVPADAAAAAAAVREAGSDWPDVSIGRALFMGFLGWLLGTC